MTLPKVAPVAAILLTTVFGAFRPPFGVNEASCGNQTTYLRSPF